MAASPPGTATMAAVAAAAVVVGWLLRRRRRQSHISPPTKTSVAALPFSPPPLRRVPSKLDLSGKSRFGLDIGGSLLKFIYLEPDEPDDTRDVMGALKPLDNLVVGRPPTPGARRPSNAADAAQTLAARQRGFREPALTVHVPALGGRLHCASFPTAEVGGAVGLLKQHKLCEGVDFIHATGGGAHKYHELLERELGTVLRPCNELDAVVLGISLMAKAVPDECFTFECVADPNPAEGGEERPQTVIIPSESLGIVSPLVKIHKPFRDADEDFFPFLLCNVGTGVSILHVQSETEYTRVSGTALGGGTFLGLTRLLTQARHFQQALDIAATGDARRVDMLVSDIYGPGDERSGLKLPGDLTASFFAKNVAAGASQGDDPRSQADGSRVTDDDICKSLVVMIAQNVAQIAHLNARLHGARRVFFTGNFLRNNDLALRTIVYTMDRWAQLDQVATEAVFFRHEGYFGAIGAFLQTLDSHFVRDLSFEGSSQASSRGGAGGESSSHGRPSFADEGPAAAPHSSASSSSSGGGGGEPQRSA